MKIACYYNFMVYVLSHDRIVMYKRRTMYSIYAPQKSLYTVGLVKLCRRFCGCGDYRPTHLSVLEHESLQSLLDDLHDQI